MKTCISSDRILTTRANVLLDYKKFNEAIDDYNACIRLMRDDGEMEDGSGRQRYPEYSDTFVGRGLAKEGLADWQGALEDYDKAITLFGGNSAIKGSPATGYTAEDGVNPYVLTFRGNVLSRLVSAKLQSLYVQNNLRYSSEQIRSGVEGL